MSLRYLIFDVDGTLAETEEAHRESFNAAFAEFGLGWTWDRDLYRELLRIGGGRERIRHYVARVGSPLADRGDFDALVAEVHRRKTDLFQRRLADGGVPLRPGVERLLREAHADPAIGLAVATTTHRGNVETLLRATVGEAAIGWFAAMACAEAATAKKPAPDVYLWLLGRLGVAPSSCLAIEDSANGLGAARAAGIPTVITVDPYTTGDDFAGAVAVLDGLGEPGAPMRVLAGDAGGAPCVDLALLRRWHQESGAAGAFS